MTETDPLRWFEQGVRHDAAQRTAEASAAYRRAVELRPGFGEAWHNLGEASLKLGDPRSAVEAFTRAQQLLPGRAEPTIALARALRAGGDAAGARALLEALVRDHPNDARAWNELGIQRRAQGELPGAVEAYQRALQVDPRHVDAHHNLGSALVARGDPGAAIGSFRAALRERPGFVSAWLSLAAAQSQLGAIDEARASCEEALALAPGQVRVHLQLARVLSWSFDAAQLAEAEAAARAALALDPARAAGHDLLCLLLRKLGRLDESIAAGRTAVALAPQDPEPRINLATALLERGRAAEAVAALEPAVAAAPDHLAAWRDLGVARVRAGDAAGALQALARAGELDPTDQRVICHRIVCHELLGERAAAAALTGADRFIARFRMAAPEGWASVAEFNAALAADIRAHPSLRYEPIGLAARGGSLAQDLFSARTPAIDAFERWLRARIDEYRAALPRDPAHPFLRVIAEGAPLDGWRLSMWATLLDGGGEIATHIHEESWLSGAYYVVVPEAVRADATDRAGWFEHGRPNFALPDHRPELGFVAPEAGLLVLFPSYVNHRTLPFAAAGQQRISISFDLTPPGFAQRGRHGAYGGGGG